MVKNHPHRTDTSPGKSDRELPERIQGQPVIRNLYLGWAVLAAGVLAFFGAAALFAPN